MEYKVIKILQRQHRLPRKLTVYLFRMVGENHPKKCFQFDNGQWVAPAHCCRNCVMGFEKKYPWALNVKWLTPCKDGWESAILENPVPSSGQRTKWKANGIPKVSADWLKERGQDCPYDIRK